MSVAGGPKIVTDGIIASFNAANTKSYVSGSSVWNNTVEYSESIPITGDYQSNYFGNILFIGTGEYGGSVVSSYYKNQISSITISTWINAINFGQNGYGGIVHLTTAGRAYSLYLNNDNTGLYAQISNSGQYRDIIPPNIITTNQWINLSYSSNGSEASLYKNGIFVSGLSVNGNVFFTSNPTLNIGRYNTSPSKFSGSIASVDIYNRGLSQAEIKSIYDSTKSRFGH